MGSKTSSAEQAQVTACGGKMEDPERFMAGEIEHSLDED